MKITKLASFTPNRILGFRVKASHKMVVYGGILLFSSALSMGQTGNDDHVVLDGALYQLPDGVLKKQEFLSKGWRTIYSAKGKEDIFLSPLGSPYTINRERGVVAKNSRLEVLPAGAKWSDPRAVRFPDDKWRGKFEVIMHGDMRRLCILEKGDICRATFDWGSGEILNKKKITDIGSISTLGNPVWSGNVVLFHGGFDKENPIVRVDLMSGKISEHSRMGVFPKEPRGWQSSLLANSRATHIVKMDLPLVSILNVATMKVSRTALEYQYTSQLGNTLYRTANVWSKKIKPVWVSDYHLFVVGDNFGESGIFDVRTGAVRWHSTIVNRLAFQSVLPGKRFGDALELPTPNRPSMKPGDPKRRVIVDLLSGERKGISLPSKAQVKWLSDRYGVYQVSDGGLSKVGHYVYDLKKDLSVRVTTMKVQDHTQAINTKHGLFLFSSHGKGAYVVSVEGGEVKRIADGGRFVSFGKALELGFSEGQGDPWKTMSSDADQADQTEFVKIKQSPTAFGLQHLIRSVGNEDQEIQQKAYDVYLKTGKRSSSAAYYDPALVTLEFLKLYKANPSESENRLIGKVIWKKALSRDRIMESVGQGTLTTSRSMPRDQAVKKARWIAAHTANEMIKTHPDKGAGSIPQSAQISATLAFNKHIKAGGSPDDLPSKE